MSEMNQIGMKKISGKETKDLLGHAFLKDRHTNGQRSEDVT